MPILDGFVGLLMPILAVVTAVIWMLAYLRGRSEVRHAVAPANTTLIAYAFAVTAALIATDKVFSAQYLLWLLPFGCLLPRRQASFVLLLAFLSVLIYPVGYWALFEFQPQAVAVLAARNLLLVGLLVWVLVRYRPLQWPGQARRALTIPSRAT